MNFFKLFNLPVTLKVDRAVVRKRYLELSRETHPDYFVNDGTDKQQHVLEASAQLNQALKTLTSPDELIKYVLTEKNLLEKDEKYVLPPHFLMQMMELNEAIADSNAMDGNKEDLKKQVATLENNMYETVRNIVENYKDDTTPKADLLHVKEYYFKKKYLQRLKDQLDQKL